MRIQGWGQHRPHDTGLVLTRTGPAFCPPKACCAHSVITENLQREETRTVVSFQHRNLHFQPCPKAADPASFVTFSKPASRAENGTEICFHFPVTLTGGLSGKNLSFLHLCRPDLMSLSLEMPFPGNAFPWKCIPVTARKGQGLTFTAPS